MCGIAGVVGPSASIEIVQRMTNAMKHRGPDGEGTWSAPNVCLGHRRLSIIDLSPAGSQPMSTLDGRYIIIHNGEVYNYRELRQELPQMPYRSQTDTEVILQAYAHWGTHCVEHFVGMFAFAIWDAVEQTLFCARDNLGIKPFYYTHLGENFVFASEIRALFAAGVIPQVNQRVIYDFLARDFYEHSDETFFKGVYKLPPGHWMLVQAGKLKPPVRYWDLGVKAAQQPVDAEPQKREEKLLDMCKEAVDLHLRSDVPVGVALSGGLDSSVLLSLLDKIHPDPARVEAFSFSFDDPQYSERPFVEEMARQTGRPAHFVEITPAVFAECAIAFCESQEEPFAGLPISAYTLCFQLARQHGFIVIMDGSGLDEGLAGYDRFRVARWADLFENGQMQVLERELSACHISTPEARRKALSQIYEASQPQFDVGKGQDLTSSVRPDCLNPDFIATAAHPLPVFERPFPDHLRNLMYRELRYTKLPRALRFRDRLSMAASCELRPPFLDHRLLAYEFSLPPEDYIENGITKAILRRATRRLLPDVVRTAAKRQVQTPQREWFRNQLRDWVREQIDTKSFWERGWVERKAGLSAMQAFFNGEGDNSFFLWQWINLEIWAKTFIDQK
ncbi:MAG: asparagine synthase (glutamine-hydrolyzing) [Anaerolineae bacterium]|nr:asparagine synthase (glutamine-hydrolyzing) [Anaerolineae bacterium]